MAEGAPLLREYGVYSLIEGSNPSCSANIKPQVIDLLGVFLFYQRTVHLLVHLARDLKS